MSKTAPLIPLVAVVGPTASGKSALAVELARFCNGEVVSADSKQIYRYMSIGTAAVSYTHLTLPTILLV